MATRPGEVPDRRPAVLDKNHLNDGLGNMPRHPRERAATLRQLEGFKRPLKRTHEQRVVGPRRVKTGRDKIALDGNKRGGTQRRADGKSRLRTRHTAEVGRRPLLLVGLLFKLLLSAQAGDHPIDVEHVEPLLIRCHLRHRGSRGGIQLTETLAPGVAIEDAPTLVILSGHADSLVRVAAKAHPTE